MSTDANPESDSRPPRPLPPDISEEEFHAALKDFREFLSEGAVTASENYVRFEDAVGDEPAFTNSSDDTPTVTELGQSKEDYRDPFSIFDADYFVPSAALEPSSVTEVQQIVEIANSYGIPLWTIGKGNNNAYGGAAPRLPGSIIIDMARMDSILEVNEKFGYALVEPGVSYFDLYDYIQDEGLDLWLDVPDLGYGSVVGNTLEHGVGYTPYGDHYMFQSGMEVVLPDGDLVRTGMGALPDNNTWQLFPYGYGPHHDGLFTQSNFGIVTKMGIQLMPEPPGYRPYMVSFPREEDLEEIVEIMRPLRINQVIQNTPTIRHVLLDAAAVGSKDDYYEGDGPIPKDAIEDIMEDQNLGFWNFYGALYGPEPMMDGNWATIKDAFSQIPGAEFYIGEGAHDHPVYEDRSKIMKGVPTMEEEAIFNWVENGGHIDFSPVLPATGEDSMKQYEMVRDACHDAGKDYISTFTIGMREMHHICLMLFDTDDPDDKERTFELCNQLIEEAAELGYGEYRTHLALMDQIAQTYDFNDGAMARLNEQLKDSLDPNGILAPGKQGIWPEHLRDKNL